MAQRTQVSHSFVDQIPKDLDRYTLYISIPYRMTAHLCMCGCGEKVAHPLRPHRWALTFDGSAVSLSPSIGNDGLPCRSHYFITKSEVIWHPKLSDAQIAGARARDGWLPTEPVQRQALERASFGSRLLRRIRRMFGRQ